ncbi:CatB-related O-acetyltransferase [Mucilaginibacter sp.]
MIKALYNKITSVKLVFYRKMMIYLFNKMNKCQISHGVVINQKSSFQNVKIGYGTYLSTNAKIINTSIGKFCSIGPNVLCGFGIHPINGISTSPAFYSTGKQNGFTFVSENKIEELSTITIGNDVFIGANVTILDGVTIGDGAVIGAGAVVSKDIPAYGVAIGCPIKVVKFRFDQEVIDKLLLLKWWDQDKRVWKKIERYFYEIDNFFLNVEEDKTRNFR